MQAARTDLPGLLVAKIAEAALERNGRLWNAGNPDKSSLLWPQ
jgi:hypothetical protein